MDTFNLEDIVRRNSIDARWFLPFVIYRLKHLTDEQPAHITVSLRHLPNSSPENRQLQIIWQKETETLHIPPVQDRVITEWGACGVACIVIPLYTNLQILQVTQVGDGFDYWVGNENQEFGLEVSGALDEDLETRHRSKVQQFTQNPLGINGYVNVTGFRVGRSILSFHEIVRAKHND